MSNIVSKNKTQWVSPLKRIGYTAPIKTVKMQQTNTLLPELQQHLQRLWESFNTGIRSVKAVKPKQYLEDKGLDYQQLNIGFCSGQFHHRKDDAWRQPYIELGILTPSDAPVNHVDRKAYTCFGTYSVVFPLKDVAGKIVNLFAIRIKMASAPEEYLNNLGIYPCYPPPLTRRLYITSTLMDAASIIQANVLDSREAVIALHDGKWLPQHSSIIQDLEMLEEVILIKN